MTLFQCLYPQHQHPKSRTITLWHEHFHCMKWRIPNAHQDGWSEFRDDPFCVGYRIFTIHLKRTDFYRVVRSDVLKFPIKVNLKKIRDMLLGVS